MTLIALHGYRINRYKMNILFRYQLDARGVKGLLKPAHQIRMSCVMEANVMVANDDD
jgi:hypothetical protein